MASKRRITLEDWISEALSDDTRGAPCDLFILVHLRMNGVGEEEVAHRSLKGPQGNIVPVKAGDLANFFTNKACHFAQDMQGIQTFALKAHYNASEAKARHQFTVADGELTAGGELPYSRFEATEKGLMGQMMKSLDTKDAMIIDLVKTIAVTSVQEIQRMRADQRESDIVMRDMLLNLRKEGHEMQLAQMQFQRTSSEREQLLRLLPGGINMALGREVFDSESADSMILDALAEKSSVQDLEMLMSLGKLTKAQAAFILDRKIKLDEKRRKEAQALQNAPPPEEEKSDPRH